jgi:hypothetical protein
MILSQHLAMLRLFIVLPHSGDFHAHKKFALGRRKSLSSRAVKRSLDFMRSYIFYVEF